MWRLLLAGRFEPRKALTSGVLFLVCLPLVAGAAAAGESTPGLALGWAGLAVLALSTWYMLAAHWRNH